ncbi:MAG TPA: TolC family protein [Candidatus Binataceae bacterium]|nr:TolC family protein [Candidatus Binataceae bacterium]
MPHEAARMKRASLWRASLLAIVAVAAVLPCTALAQAMALAQVVAEVQRVNPQVRGARFRWESAQHQIIQNYTPVDPQFAFSNLDSWRGVNDAGEQSMLFTQALQFPGKGLLQGRNARRTAGIAHLTYLAAVRDITAQAKTAYYQIQLDLALNDLMTENVANLARVLKVTQIAYTANLATQGDYINAKFALEADRELVRQQAVAIANDKTALNILLDRKPDEPLQVDLNFDLATFETSLDQVIDRAVSARQEILEAALAQDNQNTAVTLAELEYAPDYTLGLGYDHFLSANFAPALNHNKDWNLEVSFNLPIFFWAKNEDIRRAHRDLDAAREDLDSIRTQTAGQVTVLYRQILRARETATLYQHTLIPLAHQAFEVMLISYQGGKSDFTTLISTFRQQSDARVTYLQAVNQLLAQKVALEQAAGGSLQ